jgi:hypothetical protein
MIRKLAHSKIISFAFSKGREANKLVHFTPTWNHQWIARSNFPLSPFQRNAFAFSDQKNNKDDKNDKKK